MKTETLQGFFEGRVGVSLLAKEADELERDGRNGEADASAAGHDAEFIVRPEHLVALCDAVLGGKMRTCHLESIAGFLVGSEQFSWDPRTREGGLVSRVIYAWEAPEINYELSQRTVSKFRHLLLTGENQFDDADWSALPARSV